MNDTGRGNEAVIGFLCGAIVGAGVALLWAPASGEVTRRRIREGAQHLADDTRDRFNRVKDKLGEVGHTIGDRMERGMREADRLMHDARVPGETRQGTP